MVLLCDPVLYTPHPCLISALLLYTCLLSVHTPSQSWVQEYQALAVGHPPWQGFGADHTTANSLFIEEQKSASLIVFD